MRQNFFKVKTFYRFESRDGSGLWYDKRGIKKSLESMKLHEKFPMKYDTNHFGYLCAVSSVRELIAYFGWYYFILFLFTKRLVKIQTPYYKYYNGYFLIRKVKF